MNPLLRRSPRHVGSQVHSWCVTPRHPGLSNPGLQWFWVRSQIAPVMWRARKLPEPTEPTRALPCSPLCSLFSLAGWALTVMSSVACTCTTDRVQRQLLLGLLRLVSPTETEKVSPSVLSSKTAGGWQKHFSWGYQKANSTFYFLLKMISSGLTSFETKF